MILRTVALTAIGLAVTSLCFCDEQEAPFLMVNEEFDPDPAGPVGSTEKYGPEPWYSWGNQHYGSHWVQNDYPSPSFARAELQSGQCDTVCSQPGGMDVFDGYSYTKYDVILDPEWEGDPVEEEAVGWHDYLGAYLYAQDEQATAQLSECMWRLLCSRPGMGVFYEGTKGYENWSITGPGNLPIYSSDSSEWRLVLEPEDTIEMEVIAASMGVRTSEQKHASADLYWFHLTTQIEHSQ